MRARHRVGHGVEPGLGGLGRRRACQSGRSSSRHCARTRSATLRPRAQRAGGPVDMWTTQGRCPHPHRPQQQQSVQFDCFGRARLTPARRAPHLNGRLRHLCADPDSRSHPESHRGPVQKPAALDRLHGESAAARHHIRYRRYPGSHDLRSRFRRPLPPFRRRCAARQFHHHSYQAVDIHGNISIPYAGSIRASGRTQVEVQDAIVAAIKNRAIQPQVVVSLVEQKTSMITIPLGRCPRSSRQG
jgi:hypothetical protein